MANGRQYMHHDHNFILFLANTLARCLKTINAFLCGNNLLIMLAQFFSFVSQGIWQGSGWFMESHPFISAMEKQHKKRVEEGGRLGCSCAEGTWGVSVALRMGETGVGGDCCLRKQVGVSHPHGPFFCP